MYVSPLYFQGLVIGILLSAFALYFQLLFGLITVEAWKSKFGVGYVVLLGAVVYGLLTFDLPVIFSGFGSINVIFILGVLGIIVILGTILGLADLSTEDSDQESASK